MKKTFKVEGMHCSACEMIISETLEENPAIARVKASSKTGEVSVEFNEFQIDEAKIRSIIKKEGYKVK